MAENNTPARRAASSSTDKASSSAAKSSSSSRRPKRGKTKRTGKQLAAHIAAIVGIVLAGIVVICLIAGLLFYQSVKLPDQNADFTTQTTTVYYNDGTTEIGELSVQNRTDIEYDQMNDNIRNAAIAAEDRTFWSNSGISPRGIVRSLWAIARGEELQSGSTITQQYIKVRYLTSEQTMSRKLTELALAIKINREVSKEDILAGYLNTIYFGRGSYGIERAAQTFFGVDAASLSVPQAAMLAAMINSPSSLDPANGDSAKEALTERYDYVLDGMLEAGSISQEDHDAAYDALPDTREVTDNDTYGGTNGFLLQMVVAELTANGMTDSQINGGGLKIISTFDASMQASAVETAQSYSETTIENAQTEQDPDSLHVAIASVQVGTGEVLAMYGGPDYLSSQINWATTARPAASTFKAWALIAGLRQGYGLGTVLNGSTFTPTGDSVSVHNDSNVNYGSVSLLRATSYSMNTAFTDLVTRLDDGPSAVVQAANDAGIDTGDGWDLNNRIALGTAQVSPLENATGFATIANDGNRNTSHVVRSVTDATGAEVYTGDTSSTQTIDTNIAQNAQTALMSVVTGGTGTRAQALGREVIAKTGTKDVDDDTVSAWFVGATKQVATAVMYVAGDGNADLDPYSPSGSFSSGLYPAQTWVSYMQDAVSGDPVETFANKNNISAGSGSSGLSTASYYPTTSYTYADDPDEDETEVEETQAATATQTANEQTQQATAGGATQGPATQQTTNAQATNQRTSAAAGGNASGGTTSAGPR